METRETRLSVSVLGPVRATSSQGPADLGGPLPRSVLSLLAAADGGVVATADLIDELWGAADPASAASLRSYVSRLRKALDPQTDRASSVIARVGHGYALRVDAEALDLSRFRNGVAAAGAAAAGDDPGTARDLLTAALREWQGEPFAGLDLGPRLNAAARRLARARRDATEALLAVRLDLGEHHAVAEELEALVATDPASERAWALLATALYRAGRTADALEALRRARAELADRFGLDPGPDLRALETAILHHDPSLLPPSGSPSLSTSPPTSRPPIVGASPAAPPPLPLTEFVGRRDELPRLRTHLTRARLVTLLGSGGAGKTRLALELLRRIDDDLATERVEVCWAALGGVGAPGLVAQTVADALGVASLGTTASLDLLRSALRSRRILLVIDNCEHLTEEVAALVRGLLEACPEVRVLTTSREELCVPGEVIFDVRPLAIDGADGGPGEAVELFRSRAAAHLSEAWLAGEGHQVVRQVCAELDGVPLAIELAAARLRTMSAEQLLSGLDDRFSLLTNGPRSGLTHHRALRETVAWSYDLLSPHEQRAFRHLAVLEGFDLDAAAALLGPETVGVVHQLAAKSMLVVDRRAAVPRWGMLETLRVFAHQITSPAEAADIAERHLRWVEDLTARAAPHLRGPDAAHWIDALDVEQANARRALSWAIKNERSTALGRIVAALPWFWYRRGHTAEGRSWLDLALAANPDDPALRARLLHGVATLAYLDGDMARVSQALEESVTLVDETTDPDLRSRLYGHLGYFRAAGGDLPGAVEVARAGLRIAVDAGAGAAQAEALMTLGQLARSADVEEADRLLHEAIALAERHDETWVAISSTWIAAKVALSSGRPHDAVALSSDVVLRMSAQADTTAVLAGLQTLSGAVAATGDAELGSRLLGAVDAIGERVGYSPARMDPVDSPWIRQLVADAAPGLERSVGYRSGRDLSLSQAVVLTRHVAARAAEQVAEKEKAHLPLREAGL